MTKTRKDFLYVGIQLLLFICFVFRFPNLETDLPFWLQMSGFLMATIGFIISILSVIQLGANLSIFPSPKSGINLIEKGVYSYFRHPIYTGIILSTAGYGLYSENSLRLIISISLLVLFYFKAQYEETRLKKIFPNYSQYQKKTWMFFPFL